MKHLITIDRKVTAWVREIHKIEYPKSKEELQTLIEDHNGNIDRIPNISSECINFEYISETEGEFPPEENGGYPVYEIQDWE